MKTKDLKEIGLTDEQIDSIMKWNGQDVNNAKAGVSEESKELQKKYEALEAENKTLKDQAKQHEDYADLKKFKEDYVANQDKTQKMDYLKGLGFKHPELLLDKADFSKATYDAAKKTYTGMDEVVKGLKETYKDLYSEPEKGASGGNPQSGGQYTGNQISGVEAAFYALNPSLKPRN